MKIIQGTAFPVIARSHPGSTGKNNEDRYAISAFQSDDYPHLPILLAVISDGIGGHRGGEIASEITVNAISQFVAHETIHAPQKSLYTAIQDTSNLISQQAETENGLHGMGATVATAWIIGKRLYTSHVGDSRIYLIRNHQIYQLSLDHSWIQEAIDLGIINKENAKHHPNAHVIRRYLGSPQPPDVDQRLFLHHTESDQTALHHQGLPLEPNDRILLTTDGITDLLENEELLALFEKGNLAHAVDQTIDLANQRGGFDNLSIIAIEIPPSKSIFFRFQANWHSILLVLGWVLLFFLLGCAVWFIHDLFFTDSHSLRPFSHFISLFSA
jgi:protein phosphatase